MRTRKRYYANMNSHEAGIDIWIHSPDSRFIAFTSARYDSGDRQVEQAKADATLMVDALNAYAKRGRV